MDQRCWQDQNLWVVRGRLSIRKSCSLSVHPACLLTSHNTCIHRDVCAVTPLKMKLSKHAEPFLLGIPSNSATAYDSFARSCFPSTYIKQLTAIWRLQTKVGKDEACLLEIWIRNSFTWITSNFLKGGLWNLSIHSSKNSKYGAIFPL